MLGPNGAGKTSLISIICGIVKPTSGKITVENFDIIKDFSVSKNNTRYKEPFITSSNEIMNLENKLRNR